MRRAWQYILLLVLFVGTSSATSVLTCNFNGANGGSLSSNGCYGGTNNPLSFSAFESLDWQTGLGLANQAAYNPITSGAWNATTSSLLTVGATLPYDYQGTADTLLRTDNFYRYYDSGTGLWKSYLASGSPYQNYQHYQGMFDAPDTPAEAAGSGAPGDHLLSTSGGAGGLELDFNRGISGVMFRISTPTTGDVNAVLRVYSVAHPTALDAPIYTYTIKATNAAGLCAGLNLGTPVPCNLAPYIGVDGLNGQIRSVIVSSTGDTGGVYIGGLYLDDLGSPDAPEPGTAVMFAGALALFGAIARKRRA